MTTKNLSCENKGIHIHAQYSERKIDLQILHALMGRFNSNTKCTARKLKIMSHTQRSLVSRCPLVRY